jgi:hypothetical protein
MLIGSPFPTLVSREFANVLSPTRRHVGGPRGVGRWGHIPRTTWEGLGSLHPWLRGPTVLQLIVIYFTPWGETNDRLLPASTRGTGQMPCNLPSPQALLPRELPVGPLRVASPYCHRLSAAFQSRSISSPHASQRKTLWDRGSGGPISPQCEHVFVDGKSCGTKMSFAPYH